jgi:hypothetical protein
MSAMHDLKLFVLISWISIPTVMFGGYSLLTIGGKLTPQQYGLFRAGHAHAGVLLVLSLVYYHYLALTGLSLALKYVVCAGLTLGIILQSGGFFIHAFLDGDGTRKTGTQITKIGALLLVLAIAVLVYGLITTV